MQPIVNPYRRESEPSSHRRKLHLFFAILSGLSFILVLGLFAIKRTSAFRIVIRADAVVQSVLENDAAVHDDVTWILDGSHLLDADWDEYTLVFDAKSIDHMPHSEWVFSTGNEFEAYFGDDLIAEGVVVEGITPKVFDSPTLYIDIIAHYDDETRYVLVFRQRPTPVMQPAAHYASVDDLRPGLNTVLSAYFWVLFPIR